MSDLKNKLIRLGSTNPELRPHLRPILAELEKTALRPNAFDLNSYQTDKDDNYLEGMIDEMRSFLEDDGTQFADVNEWARIRLMLQRDADTWANHGWPSPDTKAAFKELSIQLMQIESPLAVASDDPNALYGELRSVLNSSPSLEGVASVIKAFPKAQRAEAITYLEGNRSAREALIDESWPAMRAIMRFEGVEKKWKEALKSGYGTPSRWKKTVRNPNIPRKIALDTLRQVVTLPASYNSELGKILMAERFDSTDLDVWQIPGRRQRPDPNLLRVVTRDTKAAIEEWARNTLWDAIKIGLMKAR